jgi:sarcosine oxidase subunit alpha
MFKGFKRSGGSIGMDAGPGSPSGEIPLPISRLKRWKKGMNRLEKLPTLHVNPKKSISFTYRGGRYEGIEGDSIATALVRNGVKIFSRSIKYHRPRGLFSLDGESANCMMEVNGVPNVPCELTPLKEGMILKCQNVVGTPDWDLMGFMDILDRAMPAGFYYRYFHRPYRLWPFFLSQIRRTAGVGMVHSTSRLEGEFHERYLHTDICVIGGGPAGMQAALAAARQGLRVILLESRPWLGGFFDYRSTDYSPGLPLHGRARDLEETIQKDHHIRCFNHTHVIGLYNDNHITACRTGGDNDPFDQCYMEVRAKSVVVASGCMERPLIFENNDRPGVMQAGCALRLCKTYGILPGEEAVFSVGHDLGLEAALELHDLGLTVACVADHRTHGQDPELMDALSARKIPLLRGWVAHKAHGKTLKRVSLTTTDGDRHLTFDCDLLIASAGLSPVSGPLSLSHNSMAYDKDTGFFLPATLPPGLHTAGRLSGLTHPLSIEASGRLAGLKSAADVGSQVETQITQTKEALDRLPGTIRYRPFVGAPAHGKKSFVCFDTDTTVNNIHQACDMGFDRAELAKRFTAAGTGPGQGGIAGYNLPLVLAEYLGHPSRPEAPTTVRPPLRPTLLATFAGPHQDIFKRTPLHQTQLARGAVFRRIGSWKRARYFSQDLSCREEVRNVRHHVGLIDVSTLGKFRIFGRDALKALQRVYVGDMSNIPEGRAKYAAMCNEDGCLMDDGVVVKRAEDDYYVTTSTARADTTEEWIRYHTRYEDWDFHICNLTDAYGAMNLLGPKAREVLAKITTVDISNQAFPYGGYREFMLVETVPARLLRLGFLGELSYEIHLPASYMQTIWDLLLEAGKDHGIGIFGLEAQNLLRLEKGHIIIGQESEIRTTLHDLGLGHLWSRNKADSEVVGVPALRWTEKQKGRMKLVGIEMEEPSRPPKDGAIIVDHDIRGYVCTARYSFTLNKSIGLALVEDHLTEIGTRLSIFEEDMGAHRLYARVAPTPFYDPQGERLKR